MYAKLGIAVAVNTVVMFLLTYAMIADAGHFYANVNRAYMAIMMAAPMVIVMLTVMRGMYPDRKRSLLLIAVAAAVFALVFGLARTQTPIGDTQFLRSMIPHHSSAILMCERSAIRDAQIKALCAQIVKSQREEIARMQALLARR